MLEADVPYVLELDRHDHAVTIKIRREGGNVVLFQSEATVADAATAADLILAESFRRIAVTLE